MTASPPRPMSSRELYGRLLQFMRPYWRRFALAVVAMIVAASTEPLFARMMQPLVDGNFVSHAQSFAPWLLPLGITGLFALRGLASYANESMMSWIANRVVLDVRKHMFARLMALPVRYYDQHPSGNLVSRVSHDANQVTQAGVNLITVTVRDSLTVCGLLGLLFWTHWQLTLICFATIPVVAWRIKRASQRQRGFSREAQQCMGEMNQVLTETVQCQRIVKVFDGGPYESRRFAQVAERLNRLQVRLAASASANSSIVQGMIALALSFIVYFASLSARAGHFSAGDFMSFITAMLMIFPPMKRLTGVNDQLQKGLAAAESVFALLDEAAEPDQGRQALAPVRGHLQFERLVLDYGMGGAPALRGVDLDIRAGETVALVGASGSGKSSLVSLLPRFYHPTSGRILLDGVDIAAVPLADLRQNLALVSQDVMLFNDSVRANIAYGRSESASEADIIAAAQAAHAWEFIERMPEGLSSMIGDRGVRLSGGQRQRLSMARAFLKNAPILILDEATSALDTESERLVQAALEQLMRGRTTIVIAHRLSTIENADRIVVMAHGQIVEMGRHAELLALDGVYARLHQLQKQQPEAMLMPEEPQ